jgi:nitrogen regulatory protein P-II 1
MEFKLIITTVKSDLTDNVVEAAKASGAPGATILSGRGTGIREAKTFLGLTLEAQTDVVIFLLEERMVESVFEAIRKAGMFQEPGTGIAFVLPVEKVAGLRSQIEVFKKHLDE